MDKPTVHELVDAIEDVLTETLSLARSLAPDAAGLPTDCPGWTVQDNLSHMVGLEQVLGGAPEPTIDLPDHPHVRDDFGAYMERHVEIRRALPMVAVIDELEGMLPRRVAQLRRLASEGDPAVKSPFGDRPMSKTLPIRVFDLWAHEQDIRRAVGLAPRIGGPAAAMALRQTLTGWSRGLPNATLGVEGQLTIEVTGPDRSTQRVVVGEGDRRATLRGDLGQLVRAFCGRGPLEADLTGDPEFVEAVHAHLAMTP